MHHITGYENDKSPFVRYLQRKLQFMQDVEAKEAVNSHSELLDEKMQLAWLCEKEGKSFSISKNRRREKENLIKRSFSVGGEVSLINGMT